MDFDHDGLGLYNPTYDVENNVPMTEYDREVRIGSNVVVVFGSDDIGQVGLFWVEKNTLSFVLSSQVHRQEGAKDGYRQRQRQKPESYRPPTHRRAGRFAPGPVGRKG
jgi:hypothetical protein